MGTQPTVCTPSFDLDPSNHLATILSVTVYCGQTVVWIKMKLDVRTGLGPAHIVLDGDLAPPPQRGTTPQFSAHFYCGQTAGWIKMPLGVLVRRQALAQM